MTDEQTDDAVERVARAICTAMDDGADPDIIVPALTGEGRVPIWEIYIPEARAAIAAVPPSAWEKELEEALRIIAGEKQCVDNLMSNRDIARAALAENADQGS